MSISSRAFPPAAPELPRLAASPLRPCPMAKDSQACSKQDHLNTRVTYSMGDLQDPKMEVR